MYRVLRILLNDYCNLNCSYCHNEGQDRLKSDIEFDALKIFLDKVKEIDSIQKIQLSGGEPTLHPQFVDIVKYIIEFTHYELGLVTNGIVLSESLIELLKFNSIKLIISVPSLNKVNYAKITKGNIDILYKNITRLKAENIKFQFNNVFQDGFEKDTLEIIDYCKSNAISLKILPFYNHKTKELTTISVNVKNKLNQEVVKVVDNMKGTMIYNYINSKIRLLISPCVKCDKMICKNYGELRILPNLKASPCIDFENKVVDLTKDISNTNLKSFKNTFEKIYTLIH